MNVVIQLNSLYTSMQPIVATASYCPAMRDTSKKGTWFYQFNCDCSGNSATLFAYSRGLAMHYAVIINVYFLPTYYQNLICRLMVGEELENFKQIFISKYQSK